jgi:hypothetical protein
MLGMLKMSKVAFRKILNAAPANEIIEVAKEIAQNSSRTIILARYGTLSLTGLLEFLNNFADYAYFVERSEAVSPGEKRVLTFMHSYGEKGSIFLKAYAKALLADQCGTKIEFDRKLCHNRSITYASSIRTFGLPTSF